MRWLDRIPLALLFILALLLALAPFYPEPHLWQKTEMLLEGTLRDPVDVFDLLFHASLGFVLILRLIRIVVQSRGRKDVPEVTLTPPEDPGP